MSGSTDTDVVLNAVKLIGKLDCYCFTSWLEVVKALPTILGVEIPSSITNVILSSSTPDDDQHDCIWFRLDTAGNFIGIFIYAVGDWQQVWPIPQGIFRMWGDSRVIPAGYRLIDSSNPNFTAAQVAAIQATWIATLTPGVYSVFDVTYEGF